MARVDVGESGGRLVGKAMSTGVVAEPVWTGAVMSTGVEAVPGWTGIVMLLRQVAELPVTRPRGGW